MSLLKNESKFEVSTAFVFFLRYFNLDLFLRTDMERKINFKLDSFLT